MTELKLNLHQHPLHADSESLSDCRLLWKRQRVCMRVNTYLHLCTMIYLYTYIHMRLTADLVEESAKAASTLAISLMLLYLPSMPTTTASLPAHLVWRWNTFRPGPSLVSMPGVCVCACECVRVNVCVNVCGYEGVGA